MVHPNGLSCSASWRSVVARMSVVLLLLAWVSPGLAYEIPAGTATVDGDLSDWADAEWISNEAIYHGDPADASGAKWAARWESDMVYVAATIVDTDHVFVPAHESWNGQDCLEVYIDAGNRDVEGYHGTFTDAQQYVFSSTGADANEWICLGLNPLAEDQTACPAFEVSVDGDTINYEIAMRPYDAFNWDDPPSSTVLTLSTGMVIGLDVIHDSKSTTGFGMLSENTMAGKYYIAANMQDYTLVGELGVLDGDLNGDGMVSGADLDIVRANWGQAVTGAENGDPSGDGIVGGADLDVVRANWGRMAAASAVPEPSVAILLLAAGLFLLPRRK